TPLRRLRRTANGGGDGAAPTAPSRSPLAFWNGIGGFDVGAREYVIRLAGEAWTPAPWINVLANPAFGCLVSAEGGGYTWSVNSQQNALTPWPNDPVTDAPHEIVYLRDDDTHAVWTSTPQPIRVADTGYETRHGKGYTVFHHVAHGIDVEVTVCVPPADSVKLSRVRMRNVSGVPRRLTLTGFVEWALAPNGVVAAPTIVTAIDDATGALLARNAWREEFGERTAFIDFGDGDQTASGDRRSFLGDLGTIERPAALATSEPLDGRVGAALDPCGSVRTRLELGPGEVRERVFMLGDAASPALARELVRRYRDTAFDTVLSAVAAQWDDLLDVVQVETPDAALDTMVNDWLLYQTLACRVWARTAYYQASGAFGFRDQLQDVMALCVARPDLAREHLLRAASRQFAEGDVQHWWLPPSGRGLRTRMTDDRLWLAYVTAHYVEVTGDTRVLDEPIAFVTGPLLDDGQLDAFFAPGAGDTASLYEHCARAVDISLRRGRHGLPLIGTGDWNDGMNRVGSDGRGESVWLAWFTVATIDAMLPITAQRADSPRERAWRDHAAALRAAVEVAGWDGSEGRWYRRGYYDDGTPLGSRDSDDCRIDVIAQSWSVIAGANDPQRPARAMAAVDDHLIRDSESLALLLAPPFDRGAHDPGYIKAYPPGIRENGGQYTHGAIWSIFAMAMLGRGDRAHALFAMLNPIAHSSSAAAVARYRVEPYVACADVYAVTPHVGRGGWTWYTGSAGWLYRAGIEAILGFRLRGDLLNVDPCVPSAWREYRMTFTRRGGGGVATRYRIVVANPLAANRGVADATLDGSAVALADGSALVPLSHDGGIHEVRVTLGSPSGVPPERPHGGGITASRPRARNR
ncbi:MAG: glycosyl transferase family 36, partial [Betaproteobacteria bacterium]